MISIKLQSNFIEIALRHGCSPVNLLHIFRTAFPRNTSGWLLLDKERLEWVYKLWVVIQHYDAMLEFVPFVQLKKPEKNHGGGLILVKQHSSVCIFTFLKLHKWYQIAQGVSYMVLLSSEILYYVTSVNSIASKL